MSYGTLIQTVTVGAGGAASIDFTSIPGTYTDLMLIVSARTAYAGELALNIVFNNDTGANYSLRRLRGNGSAVVSNNSTGNNSINAGEMDGSTNAANTFSSNQIYIPNYAGSTAKSVSSDSVNEDNATTAYQLLNANLWTGTSAINRITLTAQGQNFVQYSSASLYGILKGSGGASVA